MTQPDHSIYASLTPAEFRLRMQSLLRFGFPVTAERQLYLQEIRYDQIAAYVVAVQPCRDEALANVIREIEHERVNLQVELDSVRKGGDKPRLEYLYVRLGRLYHHLMALGCTPMAAIETYVHASGIHVAFVNNYAASLSPATSGQNPFPDFPADFLTLTDHIEQKICPNTPPVQPAADRPPIQRRKPPGRRSDPLYDRAYQFMTDGLSRAEALKWCWQQKLKQNKYLTDDDYPDFRESFRSAIKRRRNK